MDITIYHNPRCSQSRATLELIRAHGIEPVIVEYLKIPPTRPQLERLLGLLGLGARELARRKEPVWHELGLDSVTDEGALIDALLLHPVLIERPIVVRGGRAVIARPPAVVTALLD